MSKASQEKAPAKGPRKSNEPVHWLVVVSGLKDDFWVSVNVHLVDSRKKQAEKRALTIASLQGLSRAEVKSVDKKPMRITE